MSLPGLTRLTVGWFDGCGDAAGMIGARNETTAFLICCSVLPRRNGRLQKNIGCVDLNLEDYK
jgi:hypothetical protein